MLSDLDYMDQALYQAELAYNRGEVPVGAVVVNENGYVCSEAHNMRESLGKPTAHAEIIAIEAAAKKLGDWRLTNCTLFVTLEPCLMCAGAIVNSRITRVVFGAWDPKAGATGSLYNINSDERLNHRFEVTPGVREEKSRELLQKFFSQLRAQKKR